MGGLPVYEPGFLKGQAKAIQAWCEEQEIVLNAKQRGKLVDTSLWLRQRDLMGVGYQLMQVVETEETADFNAFRGHVGKALKARKIKCMRRSDPTFLLNR